MSITGRQAWIGLRRGVTWCWLIMVLLMTSFGPATAAQDATPAINDPTVLALARIYSEAWSSGDPAQVSALYAEDAVFEELVLDGVVTRNHAELEAFAGAAFSAFSEFAITVTDGFAAGDRVALEWVLSGTYTGQFGNLPPGTGQAVTIPGASIVTLDGDRIVHQREYWDVAMLLSQVDALPGPDA